MGHKKPRDSRVLRTQNVKKPASGETNLEEQQRLFPVCGLLGRGGCVEDDRRSTSVSELDVEVDCQAVDAAGGAQWLKERRKIQFRAG